jgi:hypothetical protein
MKLRITAAKHEVLCQIFGLTTWEFEKNLSAHDAKQVFAVGIEYAGT